ncbi:MAG: EscU/YscU/HrcU family type III secretion system export apparatus switch protein [Negativicutes bacterium]|nr:EscU/YscU/HrcU family type III secretion system export apparatus switch protein [Negativicutes bacterium]
MKKPFHKDKEPTQAIAIRYDQSHDTAPRITAKGTGQVAENILDIAKKHAIPVYQNKSLSAMLMALEIDREIPPELYAAVAEVLAYIYSLDQRLGKLRK